MIENIKIVVVFLNFCTMYTDGPTDHEGAQCHVD
jgi:hypothetical protein